MQNGRNMLKSEFESRADLVRTLCATSFIPLISGGFSTPIIDGVVSICVLEKVSALRGRRTFEQYAGFPGSSHDHHQSVSWPGRYLAELRTSDGLASACQPDVLCGKIKTKQRQHLQINRENVRRLYRVVFPPSRKKMGEHYANGFMDTARFLKKHNLYE